MSVSDGQDHPNERIGDEEFVARFVVVERWIRADQTLRPDAFLPPTDGNLSVTRLTQNPEGDVWQRGFAVAALRNKELLGRADVTCASIRSSGAGMDVVAAPITTDSFHAHVTGWPASDDKARQKSIAQLIAAAASFVPAP